MTPEFLKPGDTIAIVATARWVTPAQLQPALDLIHSWGFRTKIGRHVHTQHFQLAGTDKERAADLQSALDDNEVKAILIARGGYGTVRVIDHIDFSGFEENPKWICGYSDITVLHAYLNSRGFATIHSTMPISFPDATAIALENLRTALTGEMMNVQFPVSGIELPDGRTVGLPGKKFSGKLVGGNLSVLYSLLGSSSMKPAVDGYHQILFIEDVDEMLYHMDRMMMALRRAGILRNVRALIVGGMTQMKDNTLAFNFSADNPWGHSIEMIIHNICEELNIPVIFGFPAGHQNDNRAFYLGMNCDLVSNQNVAAVHFQH